MVGWVGKVARQVAYSPADPRRAGVIRPGSEILLAGAATQFVLDLRSGDNVKYRRRIQGPWEF